MINAIYSSDDNPLYKDFEPYVNRAWKRIGINPIYININSSSEFYSAKVPTGAQSQIIRVLYPALFPDQMFITSDIDMLPLSKSYFVDSVNLISSGNEILNLTADAYDYKDKVYPICYWVSKGNNFRKVTGIRDIKDVLNIMEDWYALGYGWNTDERCFSGLVNNCSEVNFKPIDRGWDGSIASRRIDRINWKYDSNLLNQDYYIDSHLVRPLLQNFEKLKPLFDFLGI